MAVAAELLGLVLIVAAAALVSPVLGLAVAGVALIVVGYQNEEP